MTDMIGRFLGRYRILEQLGQSGHVTIYKAYDTRLNCNVVVKVLYTDCCAHGYLKFVFERLECEVKARARLIHPNIALVIDYGEQEGMLYLVMPYLGGGTLETRLGKPLPWREALRLLLPLARALEYAHRQGIVHGNLKPSAILFREDGEAVLDSFGFDQVADWDRESLLIGGRVDVADDVYGLGMVLYEIITGHRPLQGDAQLLPPTKFVPELPEVVEKVLLRMLAEDVGERYRGMGEVILAMVMALVIGQLWMAAKAVGAVGEAGKTPARQGSVGIKQLGIDRSVPVETLGDQMTGLREESEGQYVVHAVSSKERMISLGASVSILFVCVPAGPFPMGSPQGDGHPDEHPQHEVYLDEYWIGKTPVTNRQYEVFVRATGWQSPSHWKNGCVPSGKEDHPVVNVSWDDAVAFCEWLSRVSGKKIRLPTEAEWEKAARGTDGRMYPWGYKRPSKNMCNFAPGALSFGEGTTPVGRYSPQGDSPYGCVDMAGNVWEWTADWYAADYYRFSPTRNPSGPVNGRGRVLRGGAWVSDENAIRSAYRYWSLPNGRNDRIGFRCAFSSR
ncbi:MAG: bifunctional serine/threonine-protein kinase/formylglycine-generating enzyme family protein [Anaerolineales bacterium]|nr:bifunctional serine/threonine-protein kinase/formylglycine-generating enzyme family protein [Anaerolineales bacterium]MCX7609572.1 bifunctional serine/threonine-protein kinase/formylglycine-generating enzyme family protein [Anaerolineales bacterium]